jgi:hypothetical protein
MTTPIRAKAERRPQQRAVPLPSQIILHHKNDHITRQIERALIQPKEYKVNEQANQLRYMHEFDAPYRKGIGEIRILVKGLAEQADEKITIALDSMGDACRDTFVAVTALAIQKNGTDNMRGAFRITIDEVLDTMGKQRSNGAFNPEARAEVIKHIKTLCQTTIYFTMPTTRQVKRGRKLVWEDYEVKVIGPIVVYHGTIGEYSKITGKELWEFTTLSLGQWAEFIGGRVATKVVPQQLLAYSSRREPYHKRLGHYLSELFRNNARETKGIMPHGITMRALFEGAQIEPPRNRGEFKNDIDKALEQLKQDGVIGNFWYMTKKNPPEAYEIVNGRTGRWFDTYLGLFINFSPPESTREHYKGLAKKEDSAEGEES